MEKQFTSNIYVNRFKYLGCIFIKSTVDFSVRPLFPNIKCKYLKVKLCFFKGTLWEIVNYN